MNFENNFKFLFILFLLKLIDSLNSFSLNQTLNDFICGVNDSDFRFDRKREPEVRQISEAIIEIGLFYDQPFYDRFSKDLKHFVKSIMKQVQTIFEYPSMKSTIRLVVTRLIKIESHQVPKEKFLVPYLDSFCKFQYNTYWKKDKDYDLALLFSGYTFFIKASDFYPARGIARIKSVCYQLGNNCAFTTVLNFMDSWYAAHEIGHTLGANHDKNENNCERGIMGSHADGPFVWSDCSNTQIANLLVDPSYGSCLYNQPKKIVFDPMHDTFQPSTSYSADNQCSTYFGYKYTRFTGDLSFLPPIVSNPCQFLWCAYDMIRAPAKCPLEGTYCFQNSRRGKCRVGQCVFS